MTATLDDATDNVILGAMGEQHLEIIVDRIKREFGVEASVGRPRVNYLEVDTQPGLLEPIMRVEVSAPPEFADDVACNLTGRRGEVRSLEERGGARIISAIVPLAHLFGYAMDLRTRTFGRASFEMRLDSYQPVPEEDLGGDPEAFVREPRPSSPTLRRASAAVPEPRDGEGC